MTLTAWMLMLQLHRAWIANPLHALLICVRILQSHSQLHVGRRMSSCCPSASGFLICAPSLSLFPLSARTLLSRMKPLHLRYCAVIFCVLLAADGASQTSPPVRRLIYRLNWPTLFAWHCAVETHQNCLIDLIEIFHDQELVCLTSWPLLF